MLSRCEVIRMGQEIPCSVRSGDKQGTGRVLLESNEIVVRGDLRLKIPLSSLKSVSSCNGELHLKWKDGSAVFELGKHADKWAQKILNPKSTLDKLGVKAGFVISAIGKIDAEFLKNVREKASCFSATKPINDSDLVFLATEDLSSLSGAGQAAKYLADAGALWIIYPKGRQEIKEQHVLDAGRQTGLVDVKVVSFSATHTALKFVRPKAKRPSRLSTRQA